MPRAARTVLVDLPLHVVQRGINRNRCFFAEHDYIGYLRFVSRFSARFGCSVHAYCLMPNHVHLLLTPHTAEACGLLMKHVGQCYVQTVNKRLGRTGTLWEGRFHSSPVGSDGYVLACYRYIELNPVRAGIVTGPSDYPWSSYCINAGLTAYGFLRTHGAYDALGIDDPGRTSAYRALCDAALPDAVLEDIRRSTRGGHAIGAAKPRRGRPPASIVELQKQGPSLFPD